MSIRLRLTLFFTALLMFSLVIMNVVILGLQKQQMIEQLSAGLVGTAERLIGPLTRPQPEFRPENPPPGISGQPLASRSNEEFDIIYKNQSDTILDIVNLLDLDGNLIYSPFQRNSQVIPIAENDMKTLEQGKPIWQNVTLKQNEFLVYVKPVVEEEKTIGYVQVAKPMLTANAFILTLRKTMLIIGLCAILVCAAIGWFVSGLMLKKISDITTTANSIREEHDFSKRVAYSGPQDEIGQLAGAFNRMLENIQSNYARLERSLEQQRNFVADVSHELRTPLTTISGNLSLMSSGKNISEEDKQDMLKDIEAESKRLIRLVSELLTLARADIDEKLCLQEIKIRPIIDACVRQLSVLDPERSVSVSVNEDIAAYSEKTKLKQLLIILIDNAYKHSSGDIRIEADQLADCVSVSVIDYGCGITAEELETIFERFHRGGGAGTGFGLGLPIAKALARSINGSLDVVSKPNAWTCFTVRLYSTENGIVETAL